MAGSEAAAAPTRGETAWLDGLRGIAALLVVLFHVQPGVMYLGQCHNATVQVGEEETIRLSSPAAWPFVRLIFSGGSIAVEVFFVISGYVVPRRLLVLLQQGRLSEFHEALNSAVIRRPARLLLPAFATTFLTVAFFYVTGIEPPWAETLTGNNVFSAGWLWLLDCLQLMNYFDSFASDYGRMLWTVVVEFKGSMALFTWMFAIHQIRAQWRVWLTLTLVFYLVFFTINTQYAGFFAGLVTCELDLLAGPDHHQPVWIPIWTEASAFLAKRRRARAAVLHVMFIVALFLASTPVLKPVAREDAIEGCEWPRFLWHMIPAQYWTGLSFPRDFWYFWAAWLIVATVKEMDWVKALLEGRVAQYLGKHSFSLYLTHSLVTATLTKAVLILCGITWIRGKQPKWPWDRIPAGKWAQALPNDVGPDGMRPAELFTLFSSLIPIFLVAEVGTRMLDGPSVRLSQWVWEKSRRLR